MSQNHLSFTFVPGRPWSFFLFLFLFCSCRVLWVSTSVNTFLPIVQSVVAWGAMIHVYFWKLRANDVPPCTGERCHTWKTLLQCTTSVRARSSNFQVVGNVMVWKMWEFRVPEWGGWTFAFDTWHPRSAGNFSHNNHQWWQLIYRTYDASQVLVISPPMCSWHCLVTSNIQCTVVGPSSIHILLYERFNGSNCEWTCLACVLLNRLHAKLVITDPYITNFLIQPTECRVPNKTPGNFVISNMISYLGIANWISGNFALDNSLLREEVWTNNFSHTICFPDTNTRSETERFHAADNGSFFVHVKSGGNLVLMPFLSEWPWSKISSHGSDSLENAIL